MAEVDEDLQDALKKVKGIKENQKWWFAFVPKGTKGKLIVSRDKKTLEDEIGEAKRRKEISGDPYRGRCFGTGKSIVFRPFKDYPKMADAIRIIARDDAKFPILPVVESSKPGEEKEDDTADAHAKQGGAAAKEAPPLNLAPWQAARKKVIEGLIKLADKINKTKHDTASEVQKEITTIIGKLPANPGPNDIDDLVKYLRNDALIKAVEKIPDQFHDLDVSKPLLEAIGAMKR